MKRPFELGESGVLVSVEEVDAHSAIAVASSGPRNLSADTIAALELMIGKRLAHYEIGSELGKGGMGEVYRARDTKLEREVAIKVLPEAFSQDAERLVRFEREARLLASLNHPNIATLYGLEQSGETRFLVMELVPGETLAEKIARGPIPIEEALTNSSRLPRDWRRRTRKASSTGI